MSDIALAPHRLRGGLRKHLGRTRVLRGLDFDVPSGRVDGQIGLTSYEGTFRVLREEPYNKSAALMDNVTFISDVASLPRFIRVRELFALISNIHPRFDQAKARTFLENTDVKMEAKIKHLSKGMIAQLHLAVVMAIDAELLVLDEPTPGLDITYSRRFHRRLLEDYITEERTLLITTHQADELEVMLSDIMFIRDGDLIVRMQMETVSTKYAQVLVDSANVEVARDLGPIYTQTCFGQTAMVFCNVNRERLSAFGAVSTPTLSDLSVALLQRRPGEPGHQV